MFQNTRAILTGGSSGLGKLLAERLLAEGASVALLARDAAKLQAARDELIARHPGSEARVLTASCDVRDYAAVERAFAQLGEQQGAPTLLVNSAGVLAESAFEHTPLETFRQLMDINFFGTVHACKAVLPHMQRAGGGQIVNVSSMAGFIGVHGYTAYCASKHALNGFSSSLRMELQPQNIRVQLVCPPEFDSPMVAGIASGRSIENRAVAHTIPVMRAEDVAEATLRGIRSGQYEIVVGAPARLVRLGDRLFPALSRYVTDRKLASVRSRGGAR